MSSRSSVPPEPDNSEDMKGLVAVLEPIPDINGNPENIDEVPVDPGKNEDSRLDVLPVDWGVEKDDSKDIGPEDEGDNTWGCRNDGRPDSDSPAIWAPAMVHAIHNMMININD